MAPRAASKGETRNVPQGARDARPGPARMGGPSDPEVDDTMHKEERDVLEPAPAHPRDGLFASDDRRKAQDFDFGPATAAVFDDMLDRSVPFYRELQSMIGRLAREFAAPGTAVYDLGCSTGASLISIDAQLPPDRDVRFVGVDSSEDMLQRAGVKLQRAGVRRPVELVHADLNDGVMVTDASVVLLVLTLQFVRPLYRDRLIAQIHAGMEEGGCLIVVEKVLGDSSIFNRQFIEYYYEFKRANGYSELEIARKREALENVLVPYRMTENVEILERAGFRAVDVFFKWYNFCGLIAMK